MDGIVKGDMQDSQIGMEIKRQSGFTSLKYLLPTVLSAACVKAVQLIDNVRQHRQSLSVGVIGYLVHILHCVELRQITV